MRRNRPQHPDAIEALLRQAIDEFAREVGVIKVTHAELTLLAHGRLHELPVPDRRRVLLAVTADAHLARRVRRMVAALHRAG
jgi:hypothetical protein